MATPGTDDGELARSGAQHTGEPGEHAADRFGQFNRALTARLPFGLSQVVAPSVVGFALINSLTFGTDLGCLTALRSGAGWPLPLAVTVAYAIAFALGFVLNRRLNFRSHADVVPQALLYALFVLLNYLVWVLGLVTALSAAGVDYRLARLASGACEAVFLYLALRLIVFRRSAEPG